MKTNINLAEVSAAIESIMSVEALDKWFSVQERPLNKILAQYKNIPKEMYSCFHKVLSRNGLMETAGANGFMRYKITSDYIKDGDALAAEVVTSYKDKQRQAAEAYAQRKAAGDYRPGGKYSKASEEKLFNRSGKVIHLSKKLEVPHLGDTRWFIMDNRLTEGRVIGTFLDRKEVTKAEQDIPEYKTRVMIRLEYNTAQKPALKPHKDLDIKETFVSQEKLLENLRQNAIKY